VRVLCDLHGIAWVDLRYGGMREEALEGEKKGYLYHVNLKDSWIFFLVKKNYKPSRTEVIKFQAVCASAFDHVQSFFRYTRTRAPDPPPFI
jgi:hypothetical protein